MRRERTRRHRCILGATNLKSKIRHCLVNFLGFSGFLQHSHPRLEGDGQRGEHQEPARSQPAGGPVGGRVPRPRGHGRGCEGRAAASRMPGAYKSPASVASEQAAATEARLNAAGCLLQLPGADAVAS